MGDKSKVKITSNKAIDPGLRFQRLLHVVSSRTGDISLEEVLSCLFNVLKLSPASVLQGGPKAHENMAYVIDGGSLLHRLTWKKGET